MPIYATILTKCEANNMGKKRVKKKENSNVTTRSVYDKNGLFHTTEQTQGRITQTTNVSITVNPEPETGCWDGVKACFGFGKRAASVAS